MMSNSHSVPLDAEKLIELGCIVFRVNDHVTNPAVPEDDEYTVVAPDWAQFPPQPSQTAIELDLRVSRE